MKVKINFNDYFEAREFLQLADRNSRVSDLNIVCSIDCYVVVFEYRSFEKVDHHLKLLEMDESILELGVHPKLGLLAIMCFNINERFLAYSLFEDKIVSIGVNDIYVVDSFRVDCFPKIDAFVDCALRKFISYSIDHDVFVSPFDKKLIFGTRLEGCILDELGDELSIFNPIDVIQFFCHLPRFHALLYYEKWNDEKERHFLDVAKGLSSPKHVDEILWRKYLAHNLLKEARAVESESFSEAVRLGKISYFLGSKKAYDFLLDCEIFSSDSAVENSDSYQHRDLDEDLCRVFNFDDLCAIVPNQLSPNESYPVAQINIHFDRILDGDRFFEFYAPKDFEEEEYVADLCQTYRRPGYPSIRLLPEQTFETGYVMTIAQKSRAELLAIREVDPINGFEIHFLQVINGSALACSPKEIAYLVYVIDLGWNV